MAGMGGLGDLMQQAQKMQRELARIQDELKERMLEGSAGDGAVKAIVSGAQELMAVKIDPEVVDADDVESLEDLILSAVNNAFDKSRELHQKETQKATGGLNLPGLF